MKRMKEITPKEKLLHGPNIWNLAVIDNIDFMAKSFQWEICMILLEKTLMQH